MLLAAASVALALSLSSSTARSPYLPVLFVDDALFASTRGGVTLRVQPPIVGPAVITATEGWEDWAIGGYNHAIKFGPADYRIYYACIQYEDWYDHGAINERLCLARSADGVTWHKPPLGMVKWGPRGQANVPNNILLDCYEVSVFEDLNPRAAAAGRYKMLCGKEVYGSADGIHWTSIGKASITHTDDTMDTGWFDPAIGKYIVYVRRDLPIEGRNCSARYDWGGRNTCRLIGRCETTNLTDWEQGNPAGCPPVFGPDADDPMGIDLYTSGFAPYEGVQLYFPATMYTFGHAFPFGYGNDGLLDIRFAASRDGRSIRYVPGAANAREPWFELGLNRCGSRASAPDSYYGGWCDPSSASEMSRTDPHTTTNYMVGGLMESPNGEEVYMYVASPGVMGAQRTTRACLQCSQPFDRDRKVFLDR